LGDVAVGPQPSETIGRLRALECPVIMGNWDEWFLNGMPSAADDVGRKLVEIGAWWADALTDEDRAFMMGFQPLLQLTLSEDATMLCYHGSPSSFNDWLFATTPDEDVARMLGGYAATVMAGGHTHLQMVRRYEGSVIVNPGSVGLPFRQWWPKTVRIAHWAEYALVSFDGGKASIDLHRTTFDVDALLRLAGESGMPHAHWWAESWTGH
ncbi:MAG: metallophosphoesterase family protein, partial [Gaiellaceae bacterium]